MSNDLRIERMIDAPPQAVYEAFTDPAAQLEWFEDDPSWLVVASCDVRVGGRWEVSFGPTRTDSYRESSVFTEVDPPHKLAYTSRFSMPDGSSFDTTLVVTFEDRDGKTLFTIVQTGFPTAKDRDDHQGGWPGFIDRIEKIAIERAAA